METDEKTTVSSVLRQWNDVVIAEYMPLLRFVCRRVKNRTDAEDITQTVMLKGMQKWPDFVPRPGASPGAWLRTIARNAVNDFFRDKRTKSPFVPMNAECDGVQDFCVPSPEEVIQEEQRFRRLNRLLDALPPRVISFMCVWAQQSYGDGMGCRIAAAEAAKSLGLSVSDYENEKKRVRTKVMATLRELNTGTATETPPARS